MNSVALAVCVCRYIIIQFRNPNVILVHISSREYMTSYLMLPPKSVIHDGKSLKSFMSTKRSLYKTDEWDKWRNSLMMVITTIVHILIYKVKGAFLSCLIAFPIA